MSGARAAAVFTAVLFAGGTSAAFSAAASHYAWRVVKSKTASGRAPTLAVSVTLKHPRGIGVRLSSPTHVAATIYWGCTRAFAYAHWQIGVLGGFHALPHVRGKDSCRVFVAAHGRDRITATVVKRV